MLGDPIESANNDGAVLLAFWLVLLLLRLRDHILGVFDQHRPCLAVQKLVLARNTCLVSANDCCDLASIECVQVSLSYEGVRGDLLVFEAAEPKFDATVVAATLVVGRSGAPLLRRSRTLFVSFRRSDLHFNFGLGRGLR